MVGVTGVAAQAHTHRGMPYPHTPRPDRNTAKASGEQNNPQFSVSQFDIHSSPTKADPMTTRMPSGFKAAGKQLWRTVNQTFDLDAEPHKIQILAQACRVADIVVELDDAAAAGPLTVRGSMNQPVISPFISEARAQRSLLAVLLGKLGLPETDEAAAEKADRLSQIRRTGAKSARLKVVR